MSRGVVRCNLGDHHWAEEAIATEVGRGNWSQGMNGRGEVQPGGVDVKREPIRSKQTVAFCDLCGAWRGCLGLEPTPELFVEHMVAVFREVKRVLRSDGTLWLNMGDSYTDGGRGSDVGSTLEGTRNNQEESRKTCIRETYKELKPKNLVGMPWRLAFALQADGWYLRSDIIWHKPNPMPESVTDRPTKAHEYIFLLSKSERYYYDQTAILEPVSANTHARLSQDVAAQIGSERANGGSRKDRPVKAVSRKALPSGRENSKNYRPGDPRFPGRKVAAVGSGIKNNESFDDAMSLVVSERNKRTVWTIPTQSFSEAHFATFPEELIKPCILAGCPAGGTVLDPFFGSGTTGLVARANGCKCIGIELSAEYIKIAERRLAQEHFEFQGGA